MKINAEIIRKFNPCKERFDNFLNNYGEKTFDIQDFIVLENITYSDKVWVITKMFTKEQNVKWSLLCASKVLSIYEEKYSENKAPRLALEAAEKWLNNPTEENKNAANAAANAAAYAAANAAAYAAAYAAYAANAAANAAYAAAYAANAAAYAAAYAANAAYAAANAAANAAYAANAAAYARDLEEEINLLLMLECI